MRIFFTGGSGKAGRRVIPLLQAMGHHVTNADLVPLVVPGVHNLRVDLTDLGQVYSALCQISGFEQLDDAAPAPYDAVIHFAALARILIVPDGETYRINTTSTYNVLEAATRLGISKIITASSETTYGICFAHGEVRPDYLPLDEEHPTVPHDAYAMSKVAGEAAARSFAARSGADIYALRINNVLDEDDYPEMKRLNAEDPARRRRSVFAYIDTGDLAEMLRACLDTDGLGYDVFNVTSDEPSVDLTTAEIIARFYEGVPVRGTPGPHETLYTSAKAKRLLGYRPGHSWQGLKG